MIEWFSTADEQQWQNYSGMDDQDHWLDER